MIKRFTFTALNLKNVSQVSMEIDLAESFICDISVVFKYSNVL